MLHPRTKNHAQRVGYPQDDSRVQRAETVSKALPRLGSSPYPRPMRTILLIVLILLLIGAFPGWGYSSGWGFYPFGGLGLVLLIVLILALTGRL